MNLLLIILFITIVETASSASQNVKKLNYYTSAGEIVKDLIGNWNSPLCYLRDRGYLQAPHLECYERNLKETKKSKRGNSEDLGPLFRSLFSATDNNASEKIKCQLGVAWDMDKLKSAVRTKADKYYESFFKQGHQGAANQRVVNVDTAIEKQVAQLYPAVVPNSPSAEQSDKENKKVSYVPTVHKQSKFLTDIAKLLTHRVKFTQPREQLHQKVSQKSHKYY